MYYTKAVETEFEKESDRDGSPEISDDDFLAALLETDAVEDADDDSEGAEL